MEPKTYTRRENARRAAFKAGIPSERIKITVHKKGSEVRFGYATKEQPVQPRKAVTASTKATSKRKLPTAGNSGPTQREQNGVKRPAAGGLCAAVWDYLDARPATTAKQIRETAGKEGWNVNNAMCELYAWRKFMGMTRARKRG